MGYSNLHPCVWVSKFSDGSGSGFKVHVTEPGNFRSRRLWTVRELWFENGVTQSNPEAYFQARAYAEAWALMNEAVTPWEPERPEWPGG